MIVRLNNRAHRRLIRIVDYLVKHSPAGARSVRDAIKKAFQTLETLPMAGHALGETGIRKYIVPRYGYRLYYIVDGDTVTVISIRHPAEDKEVPE